jgi:hypothetical protein
LLPGGVPDVRTLARDTELVGDLGLGTALSEQLGRFQAAGLEGGALLGGAGAAVGRHRRTLTRHLSAVNPTHETQ